MRIDTRDALNSLRSDLCPACGKPKQEMHSMCRQCFMGLDQMARERLYRHMRKGYEEALGAGLERLGVQAIVLPPAGHRGQK